MRRAAYTVVVLGLALFGAPQSHADSDIWADAVRDIEAPGKYEVAMQAADDYAVRAAKAFASNRYQAQAHARRAAFEYEKAIEIDSTQSEPHFRVAEVLYGHFVSQLDGDRIDKDEARRAIAHWEQWRKLEPKDPRLMSALFRRSLAYTKLGGEDNYKKALQDYEDQLALTDSAASSSSENVSIVMSNAAELYMAVGDIDNAITMYSQALDVNNRTLYWLGLALALERDGQATKAREIMNQYAARDQLAKELTSDTVFFIPEGDVHAYYGLGYDAQGDLEKAARHYAMFLEYQPDGRYSDVVKKRLAKIGGAKGVKTKRKPSKLQIEPETWSF